MNRHILNIQTLSLTLVNTWEKPFIEVLESVTVGECQLQEFCQVDNSTQVTLCQGSKESPVTLVRQGELGGVGGHCTSLNWQHVPDNKTHDLGEKGVETRGNITSTFRYVANAERTHLF